MNDLDAPRPSPSDLRELFLAFNGITMSSFGGVMPFARRKLVIDKGWLSEREFVEMLAIGQVLPGPNLINLAAMVGQRYFGWRGAVTALLGMLALPTAIVLVLAAGYTSWSHLQIVRHAMHGMALVAAAMVMAMALQMTPALGRSWSGVLWTAAAFAGIALLHWPLLHVMLVLGPPAVLLMRRQQAARAVSQERA